MTNEKKPTNYVQNLQREGKPVARALTDIEKTPIFKRNFKKIKVGSWVEFERYGEVFYGCVEVIREKTVMIRLDKDSHKRNTHFLTNQTVVSHGNYRILTVDEAAALNEWN